MYFIVVVTLGLFEIGTFAFNEKQRVCLHHTLSFLHVSVDKYFAVTCMYSASC